VVSYDSQAGDILSNSAEVISDLVVIPHVTPLVTQPLSVDGSDKSFITFIVLLRSYGRMTS
jgi:hypothetical protein